MFSTWDRKQWMALVGLLLVVIVALTLLWPKAPDTITIQVIDSSQGKVYSTAVVPLR